MNGLRAAFAKNTWTYFSIMVLAVALVCLFLMYGHQRREFFYAALAMGTLAFAWDFVIEYFGVSNKLWHYSEERGAAGGVPLVIPAIFFGSAVIVTFWFYAFETNPQARNFLEAVVWKLSLVQIGLIIVGLYFMVQYFRKNIYTTVFWLLPFGIALYLAYPRPWILVLAIIPMYLDYFIEKALVKRKEIEYEGYDSEMAINVAISYFPVAMVVLGMVAIFVHIFG